jgi:LEA14-like dessication related protein
MFDTRLWRVFRDGFPHAMLLTLALWAGACSSLPRTIEAPDVRLQSLTLLEDGEDGQRLAVRLRVDNPNTVPIPVIGLTFRVRLGGDGLLSGSSMEAFSVPAGGSESVVVEVDTDLVSSLSRLVALVQGPAGALAYEATGELSLSRPFRSPQSFSARGEVPLSMSARGP